MAAAVLARLRCHGHALVSWTLLSNLALHMHIPQAPTRPAGLVWHGSQKASMICLSA